MDTFTMTAIDLEEWLDLGKASIISSLAREGCLGEAEAEAWAATHTIVIRKKNIFRTVSKAWKKQEEVKGYYLLVVSLPEEYEEEDDDDGGKEPLLVTDGENKVVELKRRA